MEALKNIGRVALQHFEKLLLSIMLLLLAGAVWVLMQETQHEADKLAEWKKSISKSKVGTVKEADLSTNAALRQRAQAAAQAAWVGTNNLFNPVKWQQTPGGGIIKVQSGKEVGVEALVITGIRPLHFTAALEGVSSNGCYIVFTNEMALRRASKQPLFLVPSVLDKTNRFYDYGAMTNRSFATRAMKGSPDDPEWTLELLDTGERVVVTQAKPFVKVEGYEADLKYPPGNKAFNKLRVSPQYAVRLEGEDYKVVAINKTEVVLSGKLNEQLHTVTQMAPP
jgi:hypothetical protein